MAIVVPTSTRSQPARFRLQLELLGEPTVLLVDQLRAIDTADIHGGPLDHLDHHDLDELERVVGRYLDIA